MLLREELNRTLASKDFSFCYNLKPVAIYGAGQMGVQSALYLKKAGVKIDCFLDKNPSAVGKYIDDIPIIHPDNLTDEQKRGCLFAVAVIKFPFNSINEYLDGVGCVDICYVGHLIENVYKGPSIANVWYFEDITQQETSWLSSSFERFSDDISRNSLLQLMSWIKCGEEKSYLSTIDSPEQKYFIDDVLAVLSDSEIFVDVGAYNGNSVEKIEKFTQGKYQCVHAFEPDLDNYTQLTQNISGNKRVVAYNFGIGISDSDRNFVPLGLTSRYIDSTCEGIHVPMKRLDTAMDNKPFSFLKVYGLGIGWEVIAGGINIIKKNRPIIAINIHHSRTDFLKVPYIITSELENYDFLLRLHGYCGAEAVVYAIPHERKFA